jgi:hypothetical protein
MEMTVILNLDTRSVKAPKRLIYRTAIRNAIFDTWVFCMVPLHIFFSFWALAYLHETLRFTSVF